MSTILVIDERASERDLLTVLLTYAGHEVLQAATGEAALEIARSARPDVTISDIVMPTMDGYEFVRQLRSEPELAEIPVIFTTATYDVAEVRRLADTCG